MWVPAPQSARELVGLLHQAVDVRASTGVLSQARVRLDELAGVPEFAKYLAFVFTQTQATSTTTGGGENGNNNITGVRALAGVLLKNILRRNWEHVDADTLTYVHAVVPGALADGNKLIRSTAAHVIAQLVAKTQMLKQGSSILDDLMRCVASESNPLLADGAMLTLLFVAEDACLILDTDETGRPSTKLIPFWVRTITHPNSLFRERSLDSIACFYIIMPPILSLQVDDLLAQLDVLQHNDPAAQTRKRVLFALASLLHQFPERMDGARFRSCVTFALQCLRDPSDDVAREACEFFEAAMSMNHPDTNVLGEFVHQLIPALVDRMTYTEDDLLALEDQCQIDAHIPDRLEDIRQTGNFGSAHSSRFISGSRSDLVARDLEGGVGDEGNNDDEGNGNGWLNDEEPTWTTRRLATGVLETLAATLPPAMFMGIFLPDISMRLRTAANAAAASANASPRTPASNSSEFSWLKQEGAIMALGCIAPGPCGPMLLPHVPQLLQLLLPTIQQQPQQVKATEDWHVLMRKCAIWTVGRFSKFIVSLTGDVFSASLGVLLERLRDRNKGVQFAALCALKDLFEATHGLEAMVPYMFTTLQCLIQALAHLQLNNIYYLYEALTSLFKASPGNGVLRDPRLVAVYLPVALEAFKQAEPLNPNLGAIAWFLAQVCFVLGPQFRPVVWDVLKKCGDLLEEGLGYAATAQSVGEELGEGDFEYIAYVLEFLSSVIDNVRGDLLGADVAEQATRCVRFTVHCVGLPDSEVIRCALGVLGDLCMYAPAFLFNDAQNLYGLLLDKAEDVEEARSNADLCKNAIWAMAELARVRPIQDQSGFVRAVKVAFVYVLMRQDSEEFAQNLEDVSAYLAARLVQSNLEWFAQAMAFVGDNNTHPALALKFWIKILFRMDDADAGKAECVRGWAMLMHARIGEFAAPNAVLVLALLATLDFRGQDPQLHQMLQAMLVSLRQAHASEQEWAKKWNAVPGDASRARVMEVYGVTG